MLLLVRVQACICCATPTNLGPTGDSGTTRWLFRHVMAFVRDGVILTSSRKVLKRLYVGVDVPLSQYVRIVQLTQVCCMYALQLQGSSILEAARASFSAAHKACRGQ